MNIFWGIGGAMDAPSAQTEATEAKRRAASAKSVADDVGRRLDRALLACEAMWTLLRDRVGVSDLDLLNRMNELDLSDGALDGKVSKSAVTCPSCRRTISRRHPKCMYCGQEVMHDPFV